MKEEEDGCVGNVNLFCYHAYQKRERERRLEAIRVRYLNNTRLGIIFRQRLLHSYKRGKQG